MFRKTVLIMLCFVLCLSLSCCGKNDGIVSVNGEAVDEAYFKYYFTEWKNTIESQHGADAWKDATLDGKPALEYVRERALQSVIEDKIILMKAKEDNIQLSEEDKKNIDYLKQQWIQQFGGKKEFLDNINNTYGITEENFDYMMEAVHYREKVIDKYVAVKDNDVRKYYDDNIAKVKHILIATVDLSTGVPLSAEQLNESNEKVSEIKSKIAEGVDFDTLVSEYTQDQNVFYYVGKGYSLDENGVQSGGMVPEFEEASFMLKVGEISEVVESTYGYHIIKRYENDDSMFDKSKNTMSYVMKSEQFVDVIEKWKNQMNIVVNNEIYNTYK